MDVPSIDGPNTWLVSRAVAREGLKVACSGLGGDELFFGYPSFNVVPKIASWTRALAPLHFFRYQTSEIGTYLPTIPRLSRALDASLVGAGIAALWFAKRGLYSAGEVRNILTESAWRSAKKVDPLARVENLPIPCDIDQKRKVSFLELSVYMHDQLLRDTDAMSMAHGLEVRVPLIAKPVVELVASFGAKAQVGLRTKSLLRDAIAHQVPASLLEQPKFGFSLDWDRLWPGKIPSWVASELANVIQTCPTNSTSAFRGSSPPSNFVLYALAMNIKMLKLVS
jgi:asparagine synthase (glutamine-hydrolysing)